MPNLPVAQQRGLILVAALSPQTRFPLGAVVTNRAVAATFKTGMEYFNTFGGSPVASEVGLAVLDALHNQVCPVSFMSMKVCMVAHTSLISRSSVISYGHVPAGSPYALSSGRSDVVGWTGPIEVGIF